MADGKEWEKPFQAARDVIQRGDFEESKKALESLGFKFAETKEPKSLDVFPSGSQGRSPFSLPEESLPSPRFPT